MPFNRNSTQTVNNDEQLSYKTFNKKDDLHIDETNEYQLEYEDGDDEYNDDNEDEDEDHYFENIIKDVISDQSDNKQQYLEPKYVEQTQVIKVSEDDLLDQRDSLRQIFKQDLLDRYECRCDTNQGLFITKQTKLSKSLQRKLANLYQLLHQYQLSQTSQHDQLDNVNPARISLILNNSIQNQEYKKKLFRSLRSIVERVLIDALMICDQYHNQLLQQEQQLINSTNQQATSQTNPTTTNQSTNNPTTKLWCEIRSRGCQFLGPQMQDDVLRLILHALETVTRMSRKVLVLYVVHMLKKHYPKASKTSVGHVVQLLYRAGCFKVEKRENDSSLMELKKEYSKYQALRRQHDTQIIQIALESGIRMSPEQWSQKLFGDSNHKSEMQSIIDKLQSQQTLEKLIADFYDKLSTSNTAVSSSSSNASSPSSSFSTNRSNSCSSNGSVNYDMAINSLFVQVKADFEYFALINFEKKQPDVSLYGLKRSDIGSGGESLTSEDDECSSFADHDLNCYDFDDDFDSVTHSKMFQTAKIQPEQTKIVWTLLSDCLKRATKILSSHIEYSSKMMSLIIANSSSNGSSNLRLSGNQSNQTKSVSLQRQAFNNTRYELNGEDEGHFNNQMRGLVAMGPNLIQSNGFQSSKGFINNKNRTNYSNKQFMSNQPVAVASSNTINNKYSTNNIYSADFNSNINGSNKPPGFFQQSNNIFDLSMGNSNRSFNKVCF